MHVLDLKDVHNLGLHFVKFVEGLNFVKSVEDLNFEHGIFLIVPVILFIFPSYQLI